MALVWNQDQIVDGFFCFLVVFCRYPQYHNGGIGIFWLNSVNLDNMLLGSVLRKQRRFTHLFFSFRNTEAVWLDSLTVSAWQYWF